MRKTKRLIIEFNPSATDLWKDFHAYGDWIKLKEVDATPTEMIINEEPNNKSYDK